MKWLCYLSIIACVLGWIVYSTGVWKKKEHMEDIGVTICKVSFYVAAVSVILT